MSQLINANSWRKLIKEKNIKGVNLIIDEENSSLILEKYGAQALPRYFLIDKNGLIVDNDAKKPINEEIIDEINKLLN